MGQWDISGIKRNELTKGDRINILDKAFNKNKQSKHKFNISGNISRML